MPPMAIDLQKNFGKRECPACACEVAANHNRCPICGYEFPNWTPRSKSLLVWVTILILAAFVAAMVLR
jgi:hypothetical protein